MLAPEYVTTPGVWKLVAECDTFERAAAVADRLKVAGVEADVTLIGGLSVIMRNRKAEPHNTRCQPFRPELTHNWAHGQCGGVNMQGELDVREVSPQETVDIV